MGTKILSWGGAFLAFYAGIAAALAGPPDIVIGRPLFVGNGCRLGSGHITIEPGEDQIDVYVQAPQLEATVSSEDSDIHKNCSFSLAIDPPRYLRVGVARIRHRLRYSLATGARLKARSEVLLSRENGDRVEVDRTGLLHGDDVLTSQDPENVSWGKCGGSVALRVNASLELTGKDEIPSSATMDLFSDDRESPVKIIWKRCLRD